MSENNNLISRVLLLADTHLGFDMPLRPRINRRRRGPDFFKNYKTALQPAFEKKIDVVVHGGDLLFRSRVPASLVDLALEPLIQVADSGIPVFLVPGNHERGNIPLHLWARHPNLFIFDQPKTFVCHVSGYKFSFSGFPYLKNIAARFREQLDRTDHHHIKSDFSFLCIHQAVEGAQVGIMNYTFRRGPEVASGEDISGEFTAVLAGHIHRSQILTNDLSGRSLNAPVIYPGSVERTSFVERNEIKKYAILNINQDGLAGVDFIPLKTRKMINLVYKAKVSDRESVTRGLKALLDSIDADAVVRVQITGSTADQIEKFLSAGLLRKLSPPTMNISLAVRKGLREDK